MRNDKLSFIGAVTFHYCVILSGVAAGNEVEESSAYPIAATGKILRLTSFAQDDTCGANDYTAKLSFSGVNITCQAGNMV